MRKKGAFAVPEKPYLLCDSHWKTIQNDNYRVAVLPWGATEAHNYHLPYGTDTIETECIAKEAAQLAREKSVTVMVLPSIPFGVNAQQLDIKFTINMNPSTQAMVLADVVDSLNEHDIEKLVVLNGHGGSNFRQIIRELQNQTEIFLCQVDWFLIAPEANLFDEIGDHAGEMETSLMLHLAPDLVLPLDQAGKGRAKHFGVSGLNEKWAWAPRKWTEITDDTGVGNPAAATAAKGEQYFKAITNTIAGFLIELEHTANDELYRFNYD